MPIAIGEQDSAKANFNFGRSKKLPAGLRLLCFASHELAAALMKFEVDQQIPPALYVAIAEVLAWAYRLEADAGAG